MAAWLERFPAEIQSREDTYLVDPQLRGLSVKIRGGAALEVKVYRGSPGILDLPGPRPRTTWSPGRSGPFRSARSARTAVTWPCGDRSGRDGGSAGSPRSPPASRDWARNRSARWNSPRSASPARTRWTLGFEGDRPRRRAPRRTAGHRGARVRPGPARQRGTRPGMNPGPGHGVALPAAGRRASRRRLKAVLTGDGMQPPAGRNAPAGLSQAPAPWPGVPCRSRSAATPRRP